MTKQVRQSIAPTHILGSTGTVEGSDLGFRSLTTFPFPNMPTVAGNPIVARGSNSDGDFVRFADGTQICFLRGVRPDQSGSSPVSFIARTSGDFHMTLDPVTWTFPQPFVNIPAISIHGTRPASDRSVFATSHARPSTTAVTLIRCHWEGGSVAFDFHPDLHCIAIGSWF